MIGGKYLSDKSIVKQRFIFLDFIKTLAIYLVCFYHFNSLSINFLKNPSFSTFLNYFIKGIASVGVPLFFMVNGALMLNRNYDLKTHIKKIFNIVVLTVIWAMITLLALSAIRENPYSVREFINSLWTLERGTISHLWFLQALVCVYILFPLIKEVYDKENKSLLKYVLVGVFVFTFGNVLLNMIVNIIEFIARTNYISLSRFNFFDRFSMFRGSYAYTIVYFILGALLLAKLKSGIKIKSKTMIALLIISMLALFLYGTMMSYSNKRIYDTVWSGYDTVMILLASISIFSLSFFAENKLKKISPVVKLIGENTLGIYFVHRIVGSILKIFYRTLSFNRSIFFNLILAALIVALSLALTLLLKKIPIIKLLFRI